MIHGKVHENCLTGCFNVSREHAKSQLGEKTHIIVLSARVNASHFS